MQEDQEKAIAIFFFFLFFRGFGLFLSLFLLFLLVEVDLEGFFRRLFLVGGDDSRCSDIVAGS